MNIFAAQMKHKHLTPILSNLKNVGGGGDFTQVILSYYMRSFFVILL